MKQLNCKICGKPQSVGDSTIAVTCGNCCLMSTKEQNEKEKISRSKYSGQELKEFRKKRSWTQKDLFLYLKGEVSLLNISNFETDKIIAPKAISDLLEKERTNSGNPKEKK